MPPIVTIVTVTYNRAHILPKCVDSVLSQDYPDLRLLIVDDGSTDETATLLKRFEEDSRVEVIRHDTNQGVAAARNTALAHLSDDVTYFCYVDSDDMLLPGAISKAVDVIEACGLRYSMVYAAAADADTGELQGSGRRSNGETMRSGEITFDDYLCGRLVGDSFQLVRRDLLGAMRHDDRANGGEGILWARILRIKPALLIEDILKIVDRSGSDRVTHYRYDRAHAEGRMWMSMHELQHIGADMRRMCPRQYAQLLRTLAHQAAMAGNSRRARAASRQAMRIEPSLRMAMAVAMSLTPAWVARQATRAMHWIRSRNGSSPGVAGEVRAA